jgi:hypothetical protein
MQDAPAEQCDVCGRLTYAEETRQRLQKIAPGFVAGWERASNGAPDSAMPSLFPPRIETFQPPGTRPRRPVATPPDHHK